MCLCALLILTSIVNLDSRIESFSWLGNFLKYYLSKIQFETDKPYKSEDPRWDDFASKLNQVIHKTIQINQWFTESNIQFGLSQVARLLNKNNVLEWISNYPAKTFDPEHSLTIGSVIAGNIPLVGFHDFLCILISGHTFKGKLSSRDNKLLPFLTELLIEYDKDWVERIHFVEVKLENMDAIIATGSNNTFRYFDYYFGELPHIFRKNRNGIAVLNGSETNEELKALGEDIFLYFGLGCRNVSKILVPVNYSFEKLFDAIEEFKKVSDHNKYMNNYNYYRAVYLLNQIPHLDNGFILLKQDTEISSPIGTLYYDFYSDQEQLSKNIDARKEDIQCLIGHEIPGFQMIPFGFSQHPELWDYSDDVDTIKFLSNLAKN